MCSIFDFFLESSMLFQAEMNNEMEPLDISSSLQKHAVKEVQVASWGEASHRLEKKVQSHGEIKHTNLLKTQAEKLRKTYEK